MDNTFFIYIFAREKKYELFNLFNEFTNKYQLAHEDVKKNIFSHCINVADQIITPLEYKSKNVTVIYKMACLHFQFSIENFLFHQRRFICTPPEQDVQVTFGIFDVHAQR